MIYQPAGYGGEHVPSGDCSPGGRAMIAHWKRTTGLGSDGCYNNRPIRGGTSPSLHAVGRAGDLHCDAGNATQRMQGDSYAGWLILNYEQLGVQSIIWNRQRWRQTSVLV